MAGMKEQQFPEEKPLLPEQRGTDSDMQEKGEEASGGQPCPSTHKPFNNPRRTVVLLIVGMSSHDIGSARPAVGPAELFQTTVNS